MGMNSYSDIEEDGGELPTDNTTFGWESQFENKIDGGYHGL